MKNIIAVFTVFCILVVFVNSQQVNDWENPVVNGFNK